MATFKKGQRVIHKESKEEAVIDGFGCCPNCGNPTLMFVGYNDTLTNKHNKCGGHYMGRQQWSASMFESAFNAAEGIIYKFKVTIPELTKLNQPQQN